MKYQVGNITAFDNDNGAGVQATVSFFQSDSFVPDVVVNVTLPLSRNASLAELESQAFEAAKQRLKDLSGTL